MRAFLWCLVKKQTGRLQGELQESQIKTMVCCFKMLRITKPWRNWKKSPSERINGLLVWWSKPTLLSAGT